jgi:hypothetical protein
VLRHSATGTLLACRQTNGYELDYYGILLWEEAPPLQETVKALSRSGAAASDIGGDTGAWAIVELSEHEAKMANVKLRNDPRRIVYYRDGQLGAASAPDN